ncbi:hypothetical protein BJX68DRAFT_276927 [Aspergillus pseudodeflectus]|uniref:Uncharacterized protein n=1 Tax=Aspergillus pseudodeflectus TaxID=176178 RepID=A0ABR4K3X5_9EURO
MTLGTTAIVFIRLSATKVTGGTSSLLISPGGPGGSGIDAVLSQGVDPTQIGQGQHNIVGFDPRGISRSGPVVDSWPDYPEGRAQFEQMHYPEISNAWSYGTVLGATFTHLFPGYVGRMVLDGQAQCSSWGLSVSTISARLEKLLHDLRYPPIPITPSDLCPLPMLATYSDFKQSFPNLATILSGLEQGNTATYSAAVTKGATPASPCNYAINSSTIIQDINTLIKCVDGAGASKLSTLSEFEEYIAFFNQQSTFCGDVWPNNANGVACRSFDGFPPKPGSLSGSILKTRHTANPILFVTTEVDPIAPKRECVCSFT